MFPLIEEICQSIISIVKLLLHQWLKNAEAERRKLPPGERLGRWQRGGAGRELPTSRGSLPGEAGGRWCGGEVSPASSFLWAIQEGAGWSKPCFLPCVPHVLHARNLSQARERKSGAECQCRLFTIDPSGVSFWCYFKHSRQGSAAEPSLC